MAWSIGFHDCLGFGKGAESRGLGEVLGRLFIQGLDLLYRGLFFVYAGRRKYIPQGLVRRLCYLRLPWLLQSGQLVGGTHWSLTPLSLQVQFFHETGASWGWEQGDGLSQCLVVYHPHLFVDESGKVR